MMLSQLHDAAVPVYMPVPISYAADQVYAVEWAEKQGLNSQAYKLLRILQNWSEDETRASISKATAEFNALMVESIRNNQKFASKADAMAVWKAFFPIAPNAPIGVMAGYKTGPAVGLGDWEKWFRTVETDSDYWFPDFNRFLWDPAGYVASKTSPTNGYIKQFDGWWLDFITKRRFNGGPHIDEDGVYQANTPYVTPEQMEAQLSTMNYIMQSHDGGFLEQIFSNMPTILSMAFGGWAIGGALPGVDVLTGEFIPAGQTGLLTQATNAGLLDSFPTFQAPSIPSFPTPSLTDGVNLLPDLPPLTPEIPTFSPSVTEGVNLLPDLPPLAPEVPTLKLPSLQELFKPAVSLIQKLFGGSGETSPQQRPGVVTGPQPTYLQPGSQPGVITAGGGGGLQSGSVWPILLAAGMGLAIVTGRDSRRQGRRKRRKR